MNERIRKINKVLKLFSTLKILNEKKEILRLLIGKTEIKEVQIYGRTGKN